MIWYWGSWFMMSKRTVWACLKSQVSHKHNPHICFLWVIIIWIKLKLMSLAKARGAIWQGKDAIYRAFSCLSTQGLNKGWGKKGLRSGIGRCLIGVLQITFRLKLPYNTPPHPQKSVFIDGQPLINKQKKHAVANTQCKSLVSVAWIWGHILQLRMCFPFF